MSRLTNRSRLYAMLALLLLPMVAATVIFTYFPQYASFKYSFYRWDGQDIEDYRGVQNFRDIWKDDIFWKSFQLTFILLLANLAKMWPSIFTAVVMHRVRSERWQYIYRVLFVIPMIIPAVVGLLVWKSFYDPMTGVFNKVLTGTGLIYVLRWADGALPALAQHAAPFLKAIALVFGNPWGLVLVGVMIMTGAGTFRKARQGYGWWLTLAATGVAVWGLIYGQWIHWAFWTGACFLTSRTLWTSMGVEELERTWQRWIGRVCIGAAAVVVLLCMIWVSPTKSFDAAQAAVAGGSEAGAAGAHHLGLPVGGDDRRAAVPGGIAGDFAGCVRGGGVGRGEFRGAVLLDRVAADPDAGADQPGVHDDRDADGLRADFAVAERVGRAK